MDCIGIIPARYGSTRFPGKPLALIGGKPMIERVYHRAVQARLSRVVVATDHEGIAAAVRAFGGEVVMTHPDLPSGTDRCREAMRILGLKTHVVVNIQGDEPFINPNQIDALTHMFENPQVQIATLVSPALAQSEIENPNRVKAVLGAHGRALYFSRQTIPYIQGLPFEQWNAFHTYYIHLGIYAYRFAVLEQLAHLPQGHLEQVEKLEQLRWLEHGLGIYAGITHERTESIDTPEDLVAVERKYFS